MGTSCTNVPFAKKAAIIGTPTGSASMPGDCRWINLSLNKRAYLSSVHEEHHARYAVDGIVSEEQYAQALNINAEGWFVVDLGRPYQVKLVLLYFRPNCSDCGDYMNNLVVGFSSSFDTRVNKTLTEDYETCKDSVERFDEIMIFECYDNEAYFRYVVVQLIDKGKRFLTIAEIEVAGEYVNYLGCFGSLPNNGTVGSNIPFDLCTDLCLITDHSYAAFQEETCFCGDVVKHSSPLSECNVMCPGDVDYCGSPDRVSVYEVKLSPNSIGHKYVGCSDIDPESLKLLSAIIVNITIEKCKTFCMKRFFIAFGIQNGNTCICTQIILKYNNVEDISCNKPCNGNPSQICGGINTTSIYSLNTKWSSKFNHCKDQADLDLDGICGNKQCEDGWTGEDCISRDCSINNGDCGAHECQIMKGKSGIFSECICKEGFDKSFWWNKCLDINECEDETHTCNATISTCINKEGYYECKCFGDFTQYDRHTCKGFCLFRFI